MPSSFTSHHSLPLPSRWHRRPPPPSSPFLPSSTPEATQAHVPASVPACPPPRQYSSSFGRPWSPCATSVAPSVASFTVTPTQPAYASPATRSSTPPTPSPAATSAPSSAISASPGPPPFDA
uniref:Uncharacterized protein n=1 Tax=Musa acuminata subsp. malaccensis TaxID=214687 RepID=A0A804KWH2_MUSAM